MRRLRLVSCVLTLVLACVAVPAAASASVPQRFVGVMADGPLFDRHVNLGHQMDMMVASGFESLRTVFDWQLAEPYATWADVPKSMTHEFENVDGHPMRFTFPDKLVGLAAQHGLTILPVVFDAPFWDTLPTTPFGDYSPPRSNTAYATFLTALVQRYGPHGSFWSKHPRIPRVPIRMWQIWNEPNLELYWPQPFASGYVALLRAAHDAIKRADPGAKIVLAGMPNFVWQYVTDIYNVPGARRLFDVVAVHPFTSEPAGVITILQRVRDAMDQAGDPNKPILATEVSWPSSVGKSSQNFGFETTEAGQASRLSSLLPMLAADRRKLRLIGFYHYTWVGREHRGDKSFSFAGLFRFTNNKLVAKPAYQAFRRAALAIEGCRVKGPVATRCLRH
jgi:hypothetical protein